MAAVKCSVDGCNARLQPILKVEPRDRDTWLYPECDVCGRPACDKHSTEIDGRLVCDRCRKEVEAERSSVQIIDLGMKLPPGSTRNRSPFLTRIVRQDGA